MLAVRTAELTRARMKAELATADMAPLLNFAQMSEDDEHRFSFPKKRKKKKRSADEADAPTTKTGMGEANKKKLLRNNRWIRVSRSFPELFRTSSESCSRLWQMRRR